MAGKKILIVEDDKNISKLVKYNLEAAGFECAQAATGEKAMEMLENEAADLVILDIMLPGLDGLQICRHMKGSERLMDIPVIMLTAKSGEVDRIVGLEMGADDYIVKPFSPRELILRVKAILKRGKKEGGGREILRADAVTVNVPKHKVTVKGKTLTLTQMEFELLKTLIERRGRVQSRENLLSDVWSMDSDIDTRTIDTHIKRLREKLGKSGKLIETVRGIGYRFKEEDES